MAFNSLDNLIALIAIFALNAFGSLEKKEM
jgi:hypothetical protein